MATAETEGASVHLIHTFIKAFTKSQLLDLKFHMEEEGGCDMQKFIECIFRAAPHFKLPTLQAEVGSRLHSGDADVQLKLMAELFRQLDCRGRGVVRWADVSTLLFNVSGMKVKQVHLYNDTPIEPVFTSAVETDNSRDSAPSTDNTLAQAVSRPALAPLQDQGEVMEPIGRKVRGVGLYFSEVECLKYFSTLRLHALTGGSSCYIFSLEGEKAVVVSKLTGPTAAIFDLQHIPVIGKILLCCADRYLYLYNDNFASGTPTERLKVTTPQLSAACDSVEKLVFTGGTDGAVLVFAAGPQGKLSHLQRIEVGVREWVCDLLFVKEMDQLLSCTADGKTRVWDVGWEGGKREKTGFLVTKLRAVKETNGRSVKSRVTCSLKHKTFFCIGHGHDILCWNSYISSQSHVLRGHEKFLVNIHAFENSSDVISADACGKIIVWDAKSLTAVQTLGGPDSHCAIGPLTTFVYNQHRRALVTVGRKCCVFTCNSRESNATLSSSVLQVLFCDTHSMIITVTVDRVFVWHAITGNLQSVFSDFCVSDVTAAALVNKEMDLAVANSDGEVRLLSLLNGMWQEVVEPTGDPVVGLMELPEHTAWTRRLFKQHRIRAVEMRGEPPKILFVASAKGVFTVWHIGTLGEGVLLTSWRSQLESVSLTVMADAGAYVASAAHRDCEVWAVGEQALKRSMRCSSRVSSALFINTVQAFVLCEELGVLHFYGFPGFAYLCRFSFMSSMHVQDMAFSSHCCQLVCMSATCAKSISLRNILTQYYENESIALCTGADVLLNERYALSRDPESQVSHSQAFIAANPPQTPRTPRNLSPRRQDLRPRKSASWQGNEDRVTVLGYDTVGRSRVTVLRTVHEAAHLMEVRVLEELQGTPEVVDMFASFTEAAAFYTITEACDVTLMQYTQGGTSIKRRDGGVSESHVLLSCLTRALSAVHTAGYALFLSPSKVGRIRGVWKITDVGGATPLHDPCDLQQVAWRDCPPEAVAAKKADTPTFTPTPTTDLWGVGLTVWLLYKRQHFWEGLSPALIREKLVTYDLAHRQRPIPDSLLSDSVMRALLDGTLCKADRRWPLRRVHDYLDSHGCLQSSEATYDLQPFPLNRAKEAEGGPVLHLKERGKYRLSRVVGEPTPRVSLVGGEEGGLLALGGPGGKPWFAEERHEGGGDAGAGDHTFVTRTLRPVSRSGFTALCVIPHLNAVVAGEWCPASSLLSVSAFPLCLASAPNNTPDRRTDYGALPLRSTVSELGLPGDAVATQEDVWFFGRVLQEYRDPSPPQIAGRASLLDVLQLGGGGGAGRAASPQASRRKSLLEIAKKTAVVGPCEEGVGLQQQQHQQQQPAAPVERSITDMGCSELSPFYTTRQQCGESAGWVTPFYLTGKARVAGAKQRAVEAERLQKGHEHLLVLRLERETRRRAEGSKRLGLDFLLATPRDEQAQGPQKGGGGAAGCGARHAGRKAATPDPPSLLSTGVGGVDAFQQPPPAQKKRWNHKRAPLYKMPASMIDRSLLAVPFTPQDRKDLQIADALLQRKKHGALPQMPG